LFFGGLLLHPYVAPGAFEDFTVFMVVSFSYPLFCPWTLHMCSFSLLMSSRSLAGKWSFVFNRSKRTMNIPQKEITYAIDA
jgi:hypothetical protein